MTWRTHIVMGMNTLWILPLFNNLDASILVLIPTAIFASLLPDIDAAFAKIHYVAGGVLRFTQEKFQGKYFHHRGLMHSFFVAIILTFILAFFFSKLIPLLPLIFFLAFMSHGIIDGFNMGVGYFYPFWIKKISLLPKNLQTPVGGTTDKLLFVFGSISMGLFLFVFYQELLNLVI